MRLFVCVVCGKTAVDKSYRNDQKYCSPECANKARYCKGGEETCIYNNGVCCASKTCDKCGWNPEVEQIRKEKLAKEHGYGK